EGSGRRVRRDVAAHTDAGALSAMHRHGRVPADPSAVATLEVLVTGEGCFILRRDRVDVIRRGNHRDAETAFLRAMQEAQHDLASTLGTLGVDELVEGLLPFGGLLGVAVDGALRVRILIVNCHQVTYRRAG